MKRFKLGVLLILMMFGHNYVLNQTQTMQKSLQQIHQINVTQFNLLYSIPSAISILVIIPLGFFYTRLANKLLWLGAIALSFGQLLVSIFGGEGKTLYFQLLMGGRIFQGIGAQILYMIQGHMASSWMGKYAGVIFILPELGEIANVFVTPWTFTNYGVNFSFFIGFLTCIVSSAACIAIYYGLKQVQTFPKQHSSEEIKIAQTTGIHVAVEMSAQEGTKRTIQNGQLEDLNDQESVERNQFHPQQPKSIFQAGRITWMVLVLCGINECLYFPFLDNANELVINRFCIPYEETGYYLSIPFIAAMITSAISSYFIPRIPRHKLILFVSIIPLIGHSLIYLDINCELEPTLTGKVMLIFGMVFFGMGIGTYYSVSFPAVGLSVPSHIRGMAYACMAFFQTIAMTLIPILAGLIIESEEKITKLSEGYREQSLLFVVIGVTGVLVSLAIAMIGKESSFRYNDEEELEKQQGKQLLKSTTSSHRHGIQ